MSGNSSPMTEQAEALVAEKRRRAGDTPQGRVAWAEALLVLGSALERDNRDSEAVAAARESVAVLSSDFLADPPALATAMRASVTRYVALAGRSGTPDEALLAPIAQALGDLTRAEDVEDDS